MWCARKVVIPKKNGDPQDIVNLQELNNATLRETNNTLSPVDTVSTVPTKAMEWLSQPGPPRNNKQINDLHY